jgi:hypothetical protein
MLDVAERIDLWHFWNGCGSPAVGYRIVIGAFWFSSLRAVGALRSGIGYGHTSINQLAYFGAGTCANHIRILIPSCDPTTGTRNWDLGGPHPRGSKFGLITSICITNREEWSIFST